MNPRLIHLLLLFILFQISCKKDLDQKYQFPDPGTLPKGLVGTWLETTLRFDTIVFINNDKEGNLYLKCSYDDKKFIAVYPYKISEDSIFVIDPTSSSLELVNGLNFYFNFDELKLIITIGNFTYRLTAKYPTLIFRKIK